MLIQALAVFAVGLAAVLVLASSGSRMRPHGEGCDCGDCHRWLIAQHHARIRRAGKWVP